MPECGEPDDDARRAVTMQAASEHPFPRCGVAANGRPYDVRSRGSGTCPFGERALVVVWRKRRYRYRESSSRQKLFVEPSPKAAPRRRSSERMRRKIAVQRSGPDRLNAHGTARYGPSHNHGGQHCGGVEPAQCRVDVPRSW